MSSEKAAKILSDTTVNLKYAKWIPQEERRESKKLKECSSPDFSPAIIKQLGSTS